MILLGLGNPKTSKGESLGWLTGILHLAPGSLSGFNVCPMASAGCLAACLNCAGRGAMDLIQRARIAKTVRWFEDRPAFIVDLYRDVEALVRKAKREGLRPCVRLNGTSDIPWERVLPQVFTDFPAVQFYDYTKRPGRWELPSNYHLTFSRSETNGREARHELEHGHNVAVVFDLIPASLAYKGFPIFEGDDSDLRFLDPPGHIIGLTAKGPAKHDLSGFVVR